MHVQMLLYLRYELCCLVSIMLHSMHGNLGFVGHQSHHMASMFAKRMAGTLGPWTLIEGTSTLLMPVMHSALLHAYCVLLL